jgi:hypothetical protein
MPKPTSSAPSQRMLRVGEQVRAAITQVLQRDEVRDPLIENTVISVSEVRMSPDLKIATAYVTPLGQQDHEAIHSRAQPARAVLAGPHNAIDTADEAYARTQISRRYKLRQLLPDRRASALAGSRPRSRPR